MDINFPGGFAVDARFDGFTVLTDQPVAHDGDNSALLFPATLDTCASLCALRFCQGRGLSGESLKLTLETERDVEVVTC